jgi:hypothetical protein
MITNILAHYLHSAALSHVAAAKYIIKYLKGCKYLGIKFSTKENAKLSTFLNFLIMESITATIDANWGLQNASIPKPSNPQQSLDLFKCEIHLRISSLA